MAKKKRITLISGRSGEAFKKEVVKCLVEKHEYPETVDSKVDAHDFNCGEIFTQLLENQTNKRIHFFQSVYDAQTNHYIKAILDSDMQYNIKKEILKRILTGNRDIMEMLAFGDAIKRADVGRVSVYLPMLPYARQDKKDDGRVPISGKLIFDLIDTAFGRELKNINICDLHAPQEQGFWDGAVKTFSLEAHYALVIKANFNLSDVIIVSPDSGGVKRAKSVAKLLGVHTAYVDKRREGHGYAEAENVVGAVKGKTVIFVDDIGDSYGSLYKGAKIVREIGRAKPEIYACVTHNLMSISYDKKTGKMVIPEELIRGHLKLITTNTVPRTSEYYAAHKDIYHSIINVACYFADLVDCNNSGKSFSAVIDANKQLASSDVKISDLEKMLIKF